MMCMHDGAIGATLQVELVGRGRVVPVPYLPHAEIVFRAGLAVPAVSLQT